MEGEGPIMKRMDHKSNPTVSRVCSEADERDWWSEKGAVPDTAMEKGGCWEVANAGCGEFEMRVVESVYMPTAA